MPSLLAEAKSSELDGLVANPITLFDRQSQGRPSSMSFEDCFYENGVNTDPGFCASIWYRDSSH